MTLPMIVAATLALAVVLAWARLVRAHRRDPGTPRAWRLAVLLALQPLLAGALYLVLLPPREAVAPTVLTILTEGASATQTPPPAAGGTVLALPEAHVSGTIARVPDLATALRRHPGTTRLRVVGAGLVPRDRDAARGLRIAFEPPPLPRGVVRLDAPAVVQRGAGFTVSGRVEGMDDGRVELLDPSGRRVDAVSPDADGAFALHAVALEAGAARFVVRVRGPGADGESAANAAADADRAGADIDIDDANGAAADTRGLGRAGAPDPTGGLAPADGEGTTGATQSPTTMPPARSTDGGEVPEAAVHLWIDAPAPPRVLLLAGAPNPDTRALRRWLTDAGAQVQARIALGGGVQLGSASLTDAALDGQDLLVADARTWSGLGEAGRTRVLAATRRGLGLLLRADDSLPAAALRGLQTPGFRLAGGTAARPWPVAVPRLSDETALRARLGSGSRDAAPDLELAAGPVPPLARRSWQVAGTDAAALHAGTGQPSNAPAGWWRAEGRGRIGVWTVSDSYLLPLHGRPDLYADLWSPAVATLARARADVAPRIAPGARVGERMVICGWPEGTQITAPDGARIRPVVDPASGPQRCAGVWPRVPGWHRLQHGDATRAFHVAAIDADPALRRAELREATGQLASSHAIASGSRPPPAAGTTVAGPAWPWFLAWLLFAGLAWWFERSRLGLSAAVPQRHPSARAG